MKKLSHDGWADGQCGIGRGFEWENSRLGIGDKDLLVLESFRGISIVIPRPCLERLQEVS